MKLIKSLMPPLIGTVFALACVEAVVRYLNKPAPEWKDRPIFYFSAPSRPSMQGPAYNPAKPEGTYRIGVVGDSFTFAPYMQYTDTFAFKLQELLNVSNSGAPAEVINYGVPAYSATHEVSVVEKAINEGADLILLQITLNDPEIKAHTPTGILENIADKFAPLEPPDFVKSICRFWKTPCWVYSRISNSQSHTKYRDYFLDLFENPRSWNPYASATKNMIEKAKAKNIPIVAVVFPLFGLPLDPSYPFYPIHKKVADLLEESRARHIDLSLIYKNIPLERLQVLPGVDRHPNEIAHRMAAEWIYSYLEHENLIPERLVVKDKYRTRLGTTGQEKLQQMPGIETITESLN